jgi:hypothetical protein
MNSSGLTDLTPLDTDLSEEFEANDLVEGDFGMCTALDDVLRSFPSGFCFLVGESLRLNVKVLLRGRSRLVEPDLSVGDVIVSSSTDSSRDLPLLCPGLDVGLPSLSPMDECADGTLDPDGASVFASDRVGG